MGFRFRKSISFGGGAFRLNISKSGVGGSMGGKGARITKKANGGTRYTTSIPGTGISYVEESDKKKSKSQEKSKAVDTVALAAAQAKKEEKARIKAEKKATRKEKRAARKAKRDKVLIFAFWVPMIVDFILHTTIGTAAGFLMWPGLFFCGGWIVYKTIKKLKER